MSNNTDTKYNSLNDTLSAIGKAVFVKFYYDFKNANIHTDILAKKLYDNNPGSKSTRQGFRIPRARHIFAEGQELDALKIIIKSQRVDPAVRQLARDILADEEAKKAGKIE